MTIPSMEKFGGQLNPMCLDALLPAAPRAVAE
jgi:hypothetical protein